LAPFSPSAPAALPLPEPLPEGDEFDPARLHREFAEASAGIPGGRAAEAEWMALHRQFAEASEDEFDPARLHREFAEAAGEAGLPEAEFDWQVLQERAVAERAGAAGFDLPETEDASPALAGAGGETPWAGPEPEDAEVLGRAGEGGGGAGPLERIADAVDELLEIAREARRQPAGEPVGAPGPAAAGPPGRDWKEHGWVDLNAPLLPKAPREAKPFPPPPFRGEE